LLSKYGGGSLPMKSSGIIPITKCSIAKDN
jgi:hypothetical protein